MIARVLAYDPDPDFCFALEEVLRLYNYWIKASSSGKDVHGSILNYRPDVLIFNSLMYQIDECGFRKGFERSLAALYIPIIIVTDHPTAALRQWAQMYFYQATILVKPFEAGLLKSTVTSLIRYRFN